MSFFYSSLLFCQIPSTNLYLFEYRTTDEDKVVLRNPSMLTSDNINGYNNQPKFFTDDELYFTQQRPNEAQTDLVVLDIEKETSSTFTKTRQSEYSPTLIPDNRHLSCIRVEDDGTQVLWQYPLDRSHSGQRILPHIKDIGYHFWVNETDVLLFIVGAPIRFIQANTQNADIVEISTKVGRCFGEIANKQILFVYKYTDSIWHLKAYDPKTKRSRFIAETPAGSEDFVILDNGDLLMASGSKLYRLPANGSIWEDVADLSSYDIKNISRMAYQKGNLVIVAD